MIAMWSNHSKAPPLCSPQRGGCEHDDHKNDDDNYYIANYNNDNDDNNYYKLQIMTMTMKITIITFTNCKL